MLCSGVLPALGGGQICTRGHSLCLVVRHRGGHRFPGGLVLLSPKTGPAGHDRAGPHRCRSGGHASFFQKHGIVTKRAAGDILPPFLFKGRTLSRDTGPRQTGRHPSAVPAFPEQRAHVKGELLRRSLPLRQAAGLPSAARIPPAGGHRPPGCRVWPAPRLSSRKGRGGASRQARCRGRSLRA